MKQMTFKELKSLVSVIDVANHLGYRYDRSKGITQPSFVLTGGGGEVKDRIYIKNPTDNSRQGYWRRNGYNTTGDVISFVKENLDQFNVHGNNELDRLNKVLHKFAGREFSSDIKEYKSTFVKETVFDPTRWQPSSKGYIRDKILSGRGIDNSTFLTFHEHIRTIQDRNQEGKFTYIGFPYTVPGSKDVVGYEIRGSSGFKSKASGTDSTKGMWLATFTDNPLEVKNIVIAESAFDALSYYQLHKEQIDKRSTAFVSFGGSFSDQQLLGLKKEFPVARLNLIFDKDLNGHMYDVRALTLTTGADLKAQIKDGNIHFTVNDKSFDIATEKLSIHSFAKEANIKIDPNNIHIHKPQGDIKDWNDVLQTEANTSSKYQFKR